MEADLVARAGVPYKAVPAGAVHGVGLKALPGLWRLGRGFLAARKLLRQFQPNVLFFTGGFVAIPTGLAGRNVPTLLFVPDFEPGLALKVVSRFADRIAVSTQESEKFFSSNKKVSFTGYPVRRELQEYDKQRADQTLNLSPDMPTLLVFGGSKGARSLNQALAAILPQLLPEMQVVHISGTLTWPDVQASVDSLPPNLAANYHPYPYLHEEMGAALAAADLVVSRAGASSLGEFPLFSLPSVLVPYPHAWRYQRLNASFLSERGAAVMLRDEDLGEHLLGTLIDLMRNTKKRSEMRTALQALKKPGAADSIADLLRELVAQSAGRGNYS